MDEDWFQQEYRIQSARVVWHDYDGGMYFVTICTEGRMCYFGEIVSESVESKMVLSQIGKCLDVCVKDTSVHSPYAEIPLYVIMPNHIHLLIVINDVETVHAPSPQQNQCPDNSKETSNETMGNASNETVHAPSLQVGKRWKNAVVDGKMQAISNHKGRLSVVIGGIKSAVTKYAHVHNIEFAWQTRFHDHIVRNQNELNLIGEYIQHNVVKWDMDCFNQFAHCRDGARTVSSNVYASSNNSSANIGDGACTVSTGRETSKTVYTKNETNEFKP